MTDSPANAGRQRLMSALERIVRLMRMGVFMRTRPEIMKMSPIVDGLKWRRADFDDHGDSQVLGEGRFMAGVGGRQPHWQQQRCTCDDERIDRGGLPVRQPDT